MTTFKDANQARVKLKNKVANYSWYATSGVYLDNDRYYVGISVKRLDDSVRNAIPSNIDGVLVKTMLE
jgi:hypothetical protein